MQIIFLVLLFVLGACFGSFLCCQVRRMQYKSTHKHAKKLNSRSICPHCKVKLAWYDNIPIISWLILRGKCRKCRHKIGLAEILSEILMALAFLALGTTINIQDATVLEWLSFATLIIFTIIVGFLAIYDGLYGELPTKFLIASIVVAFVALIIREITLLQLAPFSPLFVTKPLLAVLILGGLYLVLYLLSKGKWVGDGDWLLATALAMVLFEPWLALVMLCFANVLACLIMAPFMRGKSSHQIYFGPFMVIAFVITTALSQFLLIVI